jgi:hypothetical protein
MPSPSPFESTPAGSLSSTPSTPPKPAAEPSSSKPAASRPAPASSPPPPGEPESTVAPLPDIPPPLGPPGVKRESLRPKITDSALGSPHSSKNVLQGRVLSADTGEAEEGVTVILSDRLQRFIDRRVQTDALGRFAVSLPDGDWVVKVAMPSGTIYSVGKGNISASGGKVLNSSGDELGLLTIRR